MNNKDSKSVVVIVAHPDDEALWAGGTILSHPSWHCYIACLTRKNDSERASRFQKALEFLKSEGKMGDIDDGPEQNSINENDLKLAILQLLPLKHFDLIITHYPKGEYTRHIRHEEVSKAVIKLWYEGKIAADKLWCFAYEDGNKGYYPKPVENAPIYLTLSKKNWLDKYNLITETYGFDRKSWEAETTPKAEAFWQFSDPEKAYKWLENNA